MDDKQLVVELWKTTVGVQQHFNDIELRIRNIAITMLAAVLGVAAVAFREGSPVIAAIVFGAGLIAWLAFFLMDYIWYHRLLRGAVSYGDDLEGRLAELTEAVTLPEGGLTAAIGKSSAYTTPNKWWLFKLRSKELRSNDKMRLFYKLFAVPLVLGLAASIISAVLSSQTASPPTEAQQLEAGVVVRDTIVVTVPNTVLDVLRAPAVPAPDTTRNP